MDVSPVQTDERVVSEAEAKTAAVAALATAAYSKGGEVEQLEKQNAKIAEDLVREQAVKAEREEELRIAAAADVSS